MKNVAQKTKKVYEFLSSKGSYFIIAESLPAAIMDMRVRSIMAGGVAFKLKGIK